jgi:hypothetical protein
MPIAARRHSPPKLEFVDSAPSEVCDLDQASDHRETPSEQRPAGVAQRLTPAELAAEYRGWFVGVSPRRW